MILEEYVPEEYAINSERFYRFTFPSVGQEAVEVYEVLSSGVLMRVPLQDISIEFASNRRDPLKYKGSVRFLRQHFNDVELVQIKRNTYMDQVADLKTFTPFNTRMIEFTLDKLTMIAQEINDRKCEANTSTPITQLITFGSYWQTTAYQINFALDKITQILYDIDQSGEDCRFNNAPEGFEP